MEFVNTLFGFACDQQSNRICAGVNGSDRAGARIVILYRVGFACSAQAAGGPWEILLWAVTFGIPCPVATADHRVKLISHHGQSFVAQGISAWPLGQCMTNKYVNAFHAFRHSTGRDAGNLWDGSNTGGFADPGTCG